VASNKAYSGFRLSISASQKTDNSDNSNINLDEIRFVVEPISGATDFNYVSTDPTLLAYQQAGIGGVAIDNIDRINAAVKAAVANGTTLTAAQLAVIVEQQSLIQSVIDADPSIEDDNTRLAALAAAVEDLQTLRTLSSKADYDAQVGSGVELTTDELSLLSGRDISGAELDEVIEEIILGAQVPTSQEQLRQLVDHEAYLTKLTVIDEFGASESFAQSGEISMPASGGVLEAIIALDDGLAAGDLLELVIDGVVLSSQVLDSNDVSNHKTAISINTDEISAGALSDQEIDVVVRVTDLSGAVDESEVWSYTWQ